MQREWTLFAISALYVGLLFGIAYWGDLQKRLGKHSPRRPWIYSLALGVYCTSWTYYGAVGRAVESGWDFLPIYLGPLLVFVFGYRILMRIIDISKRHNITSIADFIAARYGRRHELSMAVTLIALIGVLPYIALQLKAVSVSFDVLARHSPDVPDSGLLMAIMLAAFAILFGTRQVVSSENHHGMVLAIAFESVIKLVAFVAVGVYVTYFMNDGLTDSYRRALALPQVTQTLSDGHWRVGFITQTVLAMAAIICLPRQFHVAVVESTSPADLRKARWVFPVYLVVISVFVLPIAVAGLKVFPGGEVIGDSFVLALPLAGGHGLLALGAYLGGFSAATSMVIVATIALSTMFCNEIAMPLILRLTPLGRTRHSDLSSLLKAIRRLAIILIVMLAYAYYRLFAGSGSLAHIGLLSFSAVLLFAPGLVGGIFWRRSSYAGTLNGLVCGFAVWAYTLFIPALLGADANAGFVTNGPFGIGWLKPQALFGFDGLDPLVHGTLWSSAINLLCYVGIPLLTAPRLRERLQAVRFLEDVSKHEVATDSSFAHAGISVGDLQELLERCFAPEQVKEFFLEYSNNNGSDHLMPQDRASPNLARYTERLLVGALGAVSARLILASILRGRNMQPEDVIRLLDETSHVIQFNRDLMHAALEHLPQGVSVVDKDLGVVAWNRRYVELFDYPEGLVAVGRPVAELFRYNARRGMLGGDGETEAMIERRLAHMRAGHAYSRERMLPNGTVIETRGNPVPGGGFVTSYFDVTAYKRTETALLRANETLESRVQERTSELTQLNAELIEARLSAERANNAKTRFLAAASHDLAQPLNAARLFVSALDRHDMQEPVASLIVRAENSLTAAENLIASLLDISRLDAGAQEMRLEHFAISTLLEPLAAEFRALAATRGLDFRVVHSRAIVLSDPRLLRRVLQNFLSNAVRYTRKGRVLFGCRRIGASLRIEVWDSGTGIARDKQREIFEEFRRLDSNDGGGERGLGLGLSIAERIAQRLACPLHVHSWLGKGSVFSITIPFGAAERIAPALQPSVRRSADRVGGATVLCLDNESTVIAGMEALLGNWGCHVIGVQSPAKALAVASANPAPDLLIMDYHLDGTVNGIEVAEELCRCWGDVPVLVLTADHTQHAREAATARGFTLLSKPVKPATLRALMGRMISLKERVSSATDEAMT